MRLRFRFVYVSFSILQTHMHNFIWRELARIKLNIDLGMGIIHKLHTHTAHTHTHADIHMYIYFYFFAHWISRKAFLCAQGIRIRLVFV